MKKLFLLSVASCAIITMNAQKNFDTAVQTASAVASYKTKSLFTQHIGNSSTINNELQGEPVKKRMLVMPATGTKNIQVLFTADKASDATITVVDQTNKKVLNQTAHLAEGKNNIVITDFNSLAEGNYTIELISNNETYTSNFILWK